MKRKKNPLRLTMLLVPLFLTHSVAINNSKTADTPSFNPEGPLTLHLFLFSGLLHRRFLNCKKITVT
jgi:hypothetical protein